jgi:Fe2+ transport system protein FeoA
VEEKTSQPTCQIDLPAELPIDLCECTLDCLARGQKAKVAHVSGPNRCRLLEMGFTSGTEVEIARRAAFGGPLEIRVRSYRLSLRMEEAQSIQVQTNSDED